MSGIDPEEETGSETGHYNVRDRTGSCKAKGGEKVRGPRCALTRFTKPRCGKDFRHGPGLQLSLGGDHSGAPYSFAPYVENNRGSPPHHPDDRRGQRGEAPSSAPHDVSWRDVVWDSRFISLFCTGEDASNCECTMLHQSVFHVADTDSADTDSAALRDCRTTDTCRRLETDTSTNPMANSA